MRAVSRVDTRRRRVSTSKINLIGVLAKNKSYPHVLSASPPRGMVQTRCTPVFVSSLLPQVSRSNALIAVTIKCLTAMIDHVELRYSTKCYSPSPTLSLLLTTLSPTPMIPLTTTTTTLPFLSAVEREKSEETSKDFCCGVC